MTRQPVIAVFDAGKTNKKLLLFDEDYAIVHEEETRLAETTDEDGYPCEDVFALTAWIRDSFARVQNDKNVEVRAVNFSAYGASLVYLDDQLKVIPPLYNYLKPFPRALHDQFYRAYGGEEEMAWQTASPVLGNLNSGMQLYRLKSEKPEVFGKIRYALHLPQYLSFVLCRSLHSEMTSIGCHTGLWDFHQHQYHSWTEQEGILEKFPPIVQGDRVAGYAAGKIPGGTGLHDSSAALIPYLLSFDEPFVLLSTGTWSISLNPFDQSALTYDDLKQDCLSYLTYRGGHVKASRLFAGHEHDQFVKKLALHFNKPANYYERIRFDPKVPDQSMLLKKKDEDISVLSAIQPDQFDTYEAGYYHFLQVLMQLQVKSTHLVLRGGTGVKQIFVDGGFSKNAVFLNLLARSLPEVEIYSATIPQASALGAALAMHQHWNRKELPMGCVKAIHFK